MGRWVQKWGSWPSIDIQDIPEECLTRIAVSLCNPTKVSAYGLTSFERVSILSLHARLLSKFLCGGCDFSDLKAALVCLHFRAVQRPDNSILSHITHFHATDWRDHQMESCPSGAPPVARLPEGMGGTSPNPMSHLLVLAVLCWNSSGSCFLHH